MDAPHPHTAALAAPPRAPEADRRRATIHAVIDDSRRAARRVVIAEIADHPIDVGRHADLVALACAGAVVTFAGTVRDHDHGRAVARLEYVAHPSAATVLREIAEQVAARFPVEALAVTHRVGLLEIGECALAVAASSVHRSEAFAATAALVEVVKDRLPVWKRQVLADGAAHWVDCP